jgi:hypothetical protein
MQVKASQRQSILFRESPQVQRLRPVNLFKFLFDQLVRGLIEKVADSHDPSTCNQQMSARTKVKTNNVLGLALFLIRDYHWAIAFIEVGHYYLRHLLVIFEDNVELIR